METHINGTSTTKCFTLKDVYDIFLYKYRYNPKVTNLKQQLKHILHDELNIKVDENKIEYHMLQIFLKTVKTWFTSTSNIFYRNFFNYLVHELRFLENYIPVIEKAKIDIKSGSLSRYRKTIELNADEPEKDSTGRFIIIVDCKLSQISSFKINYQDIPRITMGIAEPSKWNHPPLTVRELINWPYIGFILHLPDVTIAHYSAHVYNRYLSLSKCNEKLSFDKENCMELMQGYDNSVGLFCNVQTLITYLSLYRQAANSFAEIPDRRKDEITILIDLLITALAQCKSKVCNMNMEYSYISSKYKFQREYDISANSVPSINLNKNIVNDAVKDKLVEIMTPIFKFNISRCAFKLFSSDSERQRMLDYFEEIFKKEDEHKVEKFIQLANKDITYLCAYCNDIYSNGSSFYQMEAHIHDMHGHEDSWKCMGCNHMLDAFDLSTNNWRHCCK